MASSPVNRSQFTAIASTLVAVLVLAIGVTASQKTSEATNSLAALESDLQFQLEMAFRHDADEQVQRQALLAHVMQEWNAAPRTAADEQVLMQWFNEAMLRSLPGSVAPLPPVPEFGPSQVTATEQLGQLGPPQAMAPAVADSSAAPPAVPQAEMPITPTPVEGDVALQQPATVLPAGPPILPAVNGEPAPQPTARLIPSVRIANETVSASATIQPVSAAEQVSVNLVELAARIAGYHDGLDAVETALLGQDQPDLEFLADVVEQLEQITRDWSFVRLYYQALTDEERQIILKPRSLESTLREIGRQLERWEQQKESDFLGSFDSHETEQIANLRDKLREISHRQGKE